MRPPRFCSQDTAARIPQPEFHSQDHTARIPQPGFHSRVPQRGFHSQDLMDEIPQLECHSQHSTARIPQPGFHSQGFIPKQSLPLRVHGNFTSDFMGRLLGDCRLLGGSQTVQKCSRNEPCPRLVHAKRSLARVLTHQLNDFCYFLVQTCLWLPCLPLAAPCPQIASADSRQ